MMELLANFLSFISTDRNLITVVATRKANLPLNRHTATNSILLNSSSSSTKDSLLNSRNMVTTKDLPSQISTRDPVCCKIRALDPRPVH
jgi:hypothetical protein